VTLARAARTASALVRGSFFGAGGLIFPLAHGIVGSIWVGAVGPCSAGCIPIGPVPSERIDGLLGMKAQRTIVVLVRNIRPNELAGNAAGPSLNRGRSRSPPASFCHRSSCPNGLFGHIAKTAPRLD
jgi:hypothetical protein